MIVRSSRNGGAVPAKERRTALSDEGTEMSALGAASRVAAELEARAGKPD